MQIITIYTAKAGQGATVTAAALATLHAATGQRTLLIDAATGDLPAVLGLPQPDGPGLCDYLTDPNAAAVDTRAIPVIDNLELLTLSRESTLPDHVDIGFLVGGCDHYDTVIIDAGTRPTSGMSVGSALLVTRPCFLALRRAIDSPLRPNGVVVIAEPGRSLTTVDIEAVLGCPVVATIPHDAAIARAVDAGLLTTRIPRMLSRALRSVDTAVATIRTGQ